MCVSPERHATYLHTGYRIDGMVIRAEYHGVVRHVLLTLLLSFALGASGLASASAAIACPMATPTAASSHDCCPDQGSTKGDHDNGGRQSMMDCPFMQLCRTAPALAPTAEPVRVALATSIVLSPPRTNGVLVSAPENGLFRPPRTT